MATISPADLETAVQQLGAEIYDEARAAALVARPSGLAGYTDQLLEDAMADDEFRTALFRFVDVLPALSDAGDVIRHVHEYFRPVADRFPALMKWGLAIEPDSLTARAVAALVRRQVESLAHRFILGDRPATALDPLRNLRKAGFAFTVALLGEETLGEQEAVAYHQRYRDLVRTLHAAVPAWAESQPLIPGHPGETTPLNISVKLSALYSQCQAVNTTAAVRVLADRLTEILREAERGDCFVYVDMEHSQLTDITLETVRRVYGSDEFRDSDRVGLVLQAYLHRTEQDLAELLDWVRNRGRPVTVRLVKGAYWDTETVQADLRGWPAPVYRDKTATDAQFEKLTRTLLDHHDLVHVAFGSHNIRSLCHAIQYADMVGLDQTAYEIQTLYGMGDAMKQPFRDRGYLVREYAPIGELIPGMGYLVRRLLENTSNEGFIRRGFHGHSGADDLLAEPAAPVRDEAATPAADLPRRFRNCPARDFSSAGERDRIRRAWQALTDQRSRSSPAVRVPVIIEGQERVTKHTLPRVAPHDTSWAVADVSAADVSLADEALASLARYFPTWRDRPVADRAAILQRTADILRERRADLTALVILETGKPWPEADADIAEAIDFLDYYAIQAEPLFRARSLNELAGEDDRYFHEPRGICAVISPWNFPVAIPCGMLSAALVTGNCAVFKPAEQSSRVAYHLFRAFLDGGLPAAAAAFLPGDGETVGAHLVRSPHVATIAFTGSKTVGLDILAAAARVVPGQEHVKRVIAEMGSKNAIIIDHDADLDQAVKGVVRSAFGYAGQKCSACARAIVLGSVYDRFLERLADAVSSLPVGPAYEPGTVVGPVIDRDAHERLTRVLATATATCRLVAQGTLPEVPVTGYYIPPTVFTDVPADHELLRKELFGPILAVVRVETFDEALATALDTEYGLTGAVYSRSPHNLATAVDRFRVGNLYLNRGCTGALVGRQPFGGARMSGVGSKAGGPEYLHQFVIPRTVTESTLRRGFAPARPETTG